MSESYTLFLILAALMSLIAIAVVAAPLWRARRTEEGGRGPAIGALVFVFLLPAMAIFLYGRWSNWAWTPPPQVAEAPAEAPADASAEVIEMVQGLADRLARDGGSLEDWTMLGRSRVQLGQYALAAEAYAQAYRVSGGSDAETLADYAEAVVLTDPNALAADAGDLFERALRLAPGNPKALWYGGLVAFEREDFAEARSRWQRFLSLEPPAPENVRQIILERIAIAEQRLGLTPPDSPEPPASAVASPDADAAPGSQSVQVRITLAPELSSQVSDTTPLFVIARQRGGGGPPLAVVRRTSGELPLTVELSDANAMVPGRMLSTQREVEIVARVALGGQPVAQSGDLFGSVDYDAGARTGDVASVEINQVQP